MEKVLKRSLSFLLAITLIFSSAYVGLSEVDLGGIFAVEAEAAVYASSFSPRLRVPTASDSWMVKYNVSNNCTRYAYARISEILNRDATSLLGTRPGADGFPNLLRNAGYTASSTPKPGSVMCTSGHVAIVESVDTSTGYLIVSEGHSWTDMSGNSSLYNGICVVNGSGVLGYSTLTEGSKHGTWFDLRKIYYPNAGATYYSLVSSSGTTPPSYNYQTITPDSYYIRSNGQSTYNYLTVSETSASSGAAVNAWSFMTKSRVQIANNGDKFYTMKFPDITTANAVNVHTDSTYPTATTKVSNYKYSGSTTQTWGFDKVSGGYVIRCKANPNMVLTCNGSGQATITAYSSGNANQIWTLIPYVSGTVSFNANGGSNAPASQKKYFNQTLTLSSTQPTRSGYTFKGWGTSSGDTTPDYYAGSSYTAESGRTLYAIWETNQSTYTVKYNANGGSGAPSSSKHQSGSAHNVTSTVPTRFGYTFLGWSKSSTATEASYKYGSGFTVHSNVTLYAVWAKYSYSSNNLGKATRTVTIHTPGQCKYYSINFISARTMLIESTGDVDSKVAIYNSSGTELASNDDGGSGNNFKLEYKFNADTTYYIKYFAYGSKTGEYSAVMKAKYAIYYDANGGSGAPSKQYNYHGDTVNLSSSVPARSGYTFLGWGTSSTDTSPSYYPGDAYTSKGSKTLYAVWEKDTNSVVVKKSLNTTYTDKLSSSSDVNWYTFDLPADGIVHFNFSHEYVNTSSDCWTMLLYDANDNCLQVCDYSGNYTQNTREAAIGLPKGTYYIKIVSANKYSSAKYSFKFEFSKDSDWETEYNHTVNSADTRSTGRTYYGNLHYLTDVDYYKFNLAKDSKISISFTHDYANKSTNCWIVTLYNPDREAIRTWYFKGTDKRTITSGDIGVSAGTYYLRVTSPEYNSSEPELTKPISEYNYSSANYYFKINCTTPIVWETEGNNATNTADSLTLNQFKYGSLHSESDIDYFKINVSKSGKYVLNISHDYVDTSNSCWVFALLDKDHKQIDYMAGKGTKTDVVKSRVTYLNKGTYYIRVQKGKSYTSMANYRVMLSEHLAEPALKNVYNGPNGIEFSWKPISNATGYIIYRKEGNGGWKRLATLSGTSKSSYVDKALKAGAKYTYTVKAYKGDAYSYYNEAGLPIVRLSKAGITGLYPVSNGVRITWHKTTGAAGYMVYRSTGDGVFTKIATVKGYDSVSYIDKTAKKGVKYIYRTKAYNGASVSPTSDPQSIKR